MNLHHTEIFVWKSELEFCLLVCCSLFSFWCLFLVLFECFTKRCIRMVTNIFIKNFGSRSSGSTLRYVWSIFPVLLNYTCIVLSHFSDKYVTFYFGLV